jgi:putative ABC transport system ATP-binding protein
MNHLPAEMSGGQQQRVAVARAIAAKPPVILADEPTGNLDTKSTKEVMAILHELKDEGRTVIVITHDNEIAEEAERVIRIRDGKVVEDYINPGYEEKYGRESKKNNKNPIDEG